MYTLLLIEDVHDTIVQYTDGLGVCGFKVVGGFTAEAGLELAKTQNPDLVLVSRYIDEGKGYAVARQLREMKSESGLPLIFGYGFTGEEAEILDFAIPREGIQMSALLNRLS